MKKFSEWFYQVSKGWVTLIALVIFLAFTAIVLPQEASKAEARTGSSTSPDTSLFYSPKDLYEMADSYGKQGRKAYVRARFTFDLIFPLVYTFFLVTSISWLMGRIIPPHSTWRIVNLFPVLGMLFDYLENISTSLVMGQYPTETPVVAFLAPIFTFVKWIFVGGSFPLLISAVGVWGWKALKNKRS